MPTKTQRILGYLPGTFRAVPGVSALRSVVDAVGRELQEAENSLAALMRAHWVDGADAGAEEIDDLARIAALYGLAPRPDEGIEEFREHLKRYVRTFLEGTVTVQGLLRVTAEALGLHIDDAYEDLDTWWTRRQERLVVTDRSGHDAADALFGAPGEARGRAARPAEVVGRLDLSEGADLTGGSVLRLKVDGGEVAEVDLAAAAADPGAVSPEEMVAAIEEGSDARASHDGRLLTVASPTVGAASQLDLHAGPGDAAEAVLGLAPRSYRGSKAQAASITGTVDLSAGVDLGDERYLRLRVDGGTDGGLRAEIDGAGPDPVHTTLDEVRDAINGALGAAVASHDGTFLTLTSPTEGFDSSLIFEQPAAQDARRRLLGEVGTTHLGRGAQAARMRSLDLGEGIDLSDTPRVRLRIDGGTPITVDVGGENLESTRPVEIAAALDDAFGFELARVEDGHLVLSSPTVGPDSRITFVKLASGDAAAPVFGIAERSFTGEDATRAYLEGDVDLGEGIGLMARNRLRVAVDDGEPVEIDLRAAAGGARRVTAEELVAALDEVLTPGDAPSVAELHTTPDGEVHLVLTSPTEGSASRVAVEPLEVVRERRFVTRAVVADEASRLLLGFVDRQARGRGAAAAVLTGTRELHRGTDLSRARHLRIAVDGAAAFDVDCAGPRPRTTTLEEVRERINARAVAEVGSELVRADGNVLVLASPTTGSGSRLELTAPETPDARGTLLAVEPGTRRGRDATRVRFVGIADLGTGVQLDPGSAVALGVDGAEVVEVPLVAADEAAPVHFTLGRLVNELNLALAPTAGGAVAGHDGRHLVLTSPSRGADSRLAFELPAGDGATDATEVLFGIPAPRSYHGWDAQPATVRGETALPASSDVQVARYLRLAVDGGEAVEIDLAAEASELGLDPAALAPADLVAVIDGALGSPVAGLDGDRLTLTSPTAGTAGRLAVERATAGDARSLLLGDARAEARGEDPAPAVLEGEVALSGALDLSRRRHLRLRVDGGEPVEVEVAGAAPASTLADEVVAALDAVLPGVASLTDDGRLRLASPTAGEGSRIAVLPRRRLGLEEYPPEPLEIRRQAVHGKVVTVRNAGAAEAALELEILAPRGLHGAGLLVLGDGGAEEGGELRIFVSLAAGDRLVARRGEIGRHGEEGDLAVSIHRRGGAVEVVPAEAVYGTLPVLPRGTSRLLYRECRVSRFDEARFDQDRFAGGRCSEWGVFGASRFEGGTVRALFAPTDRSGEPAAELRLGWLHHRPGSLRVRLPADLPARFGGRLDQARFGGRSPETYPGAVLEPPADPDHAIPWILDGRGDLDPPSPPSALVVVRGEDPEAPPALVPRVPLGWEAVEIPFREPRFLTLGDAERPARIYLTQEGLEGFLRLDARAPGEWGNHIAVTTRPAGPGRFDLRISYDGARFENARQAALGAPLPSLADDLLRPGPVGVLQAKAGGVRAEVARDRALSCDSRSTDPGPSDFETTDESTDKET